MKEPLVACCKFWSLINRKNIYQLIGNMQSVYHFIFCITRVHVSSLNSNFGCGCIKVFILQLAQHAAIHGVCPFCSKFLYIEVVGTTSNFLIGCKTNSYLAMFYLWMVDKVLHCIHYLCNSGFIVGSQKGCAIGYYKVFSYVVEQLGEIIWRHYNIVLLVEKDIFTIVVFNNSRIYILATHIGASVEVCYKTNSGQVFVAIGR